MESRKSYWLLAGPAALEGMLLMLLSAVDLFMVSSLGTSAVAAVSIFGQPRMVILCVSRSFAVALTAYTAKLVGENKTDKLCSCAKQTLIISFLGGVFLLAITLLLCEHILLAAGVQESYFLLAMDYAVPALISLGFTAPSVSMHGILSGIGDTKNVLKANVFGNIVNVICNYFFIYGILFFPEMGVFGAGLGTLIGSIATLIYTLSLFVNNNHIASLKGHGKWKIEKTYLKSILPLSTGVFAEQAVERAGMFIYSRMVANLGAASVGIHNICMGLCDIYYSFAQGMGKASLILAGNDMGATSGKNIRSISSISKKESIWTAFIACAVFIILRKQFLELYHLDGINLALGADIMIFVALVSIPEALAMTHAGILRGIGKTYFVAKYSLIIIAVLRPIITYILVYIFKLNLYGAWIALFIDQSLRALYSVIGVRLNIR